jgi:pyruvate dehydrogenase E2 component (dihydrolipoamide acetyltransferase)
MAAGREVRVPDIGDYRDVPVIELLVAVGDSVQRDQGLVSLESDKATMEVPAPFAGVVRELRVKLGDTVSEGSVVALLEAADGSSAGEPPASKAPAATAAERSAPTESASAASASTAAASTAAAPATGAAASSAPAAEPSAPASPPADSAGPTRSPPVNFGADSVQPGQVPYASPAVRLFARELGVELGRVTGSGRGGRIVKEDVQKFVRSTLAGGTARSATGATGGLSLLPWPKVDFSKFGPVESQALSRIKKLSGANLARNWAMIPHVTQFEQADITEMEAFRKQLGAENKDTKVTPLVFLIKAVVAALKRFPTFNASLDESGETLVLKQYFHVGIAVDTPDGLVVPVIRDCDRKGLLALAAELGELSRKARDRKLGPADMSGGCFSISSLGGIGGSAFTPIINAPEVAILGVSKSTLQPVWNGSGFEPRLLLPLSLSYDHRVIDGAEAARFAAFLAQQLGDVRRLLL